MLVELAEPFNRLPVEVSKVSGTRLLWRDRSGRGCGKLSDNQFVEQHSWVVNNNFFCDKARIDPNTTKTAYAERYGGFGLGTNGGGARVVNINNTQIKGVGANALAGEGAPRSHSYGGLDIQGAVKEIIYSRLLNKISPVGAQSIAGLILLDETSALHNDNKAPSVLMVREPAARPGHFLPCVNFRLKQEHRALVRSDYSRIHGIYKSIGKHDLLSEFYTLIQHFLDKCADQLSFFRMARLAHNALAPSNICIDGRVLDTGLCSFVVSGANYGQVTSYLEEAATPALVAREWFYLINKFLNEKPVEEHFLKLYEDKFYQYAAVNMGFLFGLNREMSTKLSSTPDWQRLSNSILSLVSMGPPSKTSILPTVDAPDIVNDIIAANLYAVLHNKEIDNSSKFFSQFTKSLRSLLEIMTPAIGWHGQNEGSFCKAFVIQTIKRAFLSSYFFITYIGRTVDDHYASGQSSGTAELIAENDEVSNWLYENLLADHCTIYSGNGVSIWYSRALDEFYYRDVGGDVQKFKNVRSLRTAAESRQHLFSLNGYDFYPYVERLLALIDGDPSNSFKGVKNVFR